MRYDQAVVLFFLVVMLWRVVRRPRLSRGHSYPEKTDNTDTPKTWADQPEDEIFECTTPFLCKCEGSSEDRSARKKCDHRNPDVIDSQSAAPLRCGRCGTELGV